MKAQIVEMNFGKLIIPANHIFYQKKYSFAFVNLKPFSKGHILVCPTRQEKKFKDLNEIEAIELMISVRNISSALKKYYKTDSVSIVIQDGEKSGQSIDHIHVHIIPCLDNNKITSVDNDNKEARSSEDMEKEAVIYRKEFNI
jgi:bis(5'-adenosyl)-triphosphatase